MASPNPKGRGNAKALLPQKFIGDFLEVWEKVGLRAIQLMAQEDPFSFVKLGAYVVGRLVKNEPLVPEDNGLPKVKSTEELMEHIQHTYGPEALAAFEKLVKVMEGK